mgnify:CR=1 FL=1
MEFNGEITKEEIIKRLESGDLPLDIGATEDVEYQNILETEEYVTLEENDGQATIEVMDYIPGKPGLVTIWDNSYESEIKRIHGTV